MGMAGLFFIAGVLLVRREIARRNRVEAELQAANESVKILSGMLPICASCKKVRDDSGYWNQIETYIARHTAATLLLAQGVPARVVMGILGHSQITLTLGTYAHVVPELAEDAAQRIGEVLWA